MKRLSSRTLETIGRVCLATGLVLLALVIGVAGGGAYAMLAGVQ